ncbi:MAG: molybdopterin cofactor-binding domain-containing protein, partial [Gammaproteobacteria bacterium]
FLKLSGIAGGGLVLGFGLGGCSSGGTPWPNAATGVLQPNAFLQLRPDGSVVLAIHKAEMGQGVTTGLATLVAEELGLEPSDLVLQFAEPHADYGDPDNKIMVTGGSTSLKGSWKVLREAGATLREMLCQAAAAGWGIASADCVPAGGAIRSQDGTRQATFAELLEAAMRLPVPTEVRLTPAAGWRLIGKHGARVDARAKVEGSAQFSIDVQVPGMKTAVLIRCPHFGGSLRSFDGSRAVSAPGVSQVLAVAGGVAVVADGYWQARSAAALVEIEWDKGPLAGLDSAAIEAEQSRLLDAEEGKTVTENGEAATAAPARVLEAEYRVPFLAHATMEPLNAVASAGESSAEIWAGNQAPDVVQALVARALELPKSAVRVHSTWLGGGFGRRVMLDYVIEAALVSRAAGVPVKLLWSREDDTRHDWYRPAALARFRAGIGADGKLVSWENRLVASSVMGPMMTQLAPALLPMWVPGGIVSPFEGLIRNNDTATHEGASSLPYAVPYLRVQSVDHDAGIPVGVWRSVGHSQNAFFAECFADEVANALGEDPLAFRLARLDPASRHARALQLVAEKAGWGNAPAGRFQGIAVHESFGTVVAEVVEVSLDAGRARIERVVCALDCGIAVNPDIVAMQAESGILFALGAALHGRITIRDGAVEQGNFDDYPLLRMSESPAIEVHILPSEADPSGIGEPPTPPLAP